MDRISGFPDDVIRHILSFLPTQSCLQTSALAKRWRFLWCDVPFLGFTCNGNCAGCREDSEIAEQVNRVILPHARNINIFHTDLGTSDNHEFETWIVDIFARNVRNLVIRLNDPLALPRCLFNSKTLVDLCIFDCGGIPMDDTVHFPALKKLRLVNIGYDFDDSLFHLISRCPVLEELIAERMHFFSYLISSPTLTRLVMDVDNGMGMMLDNPTLKYLRFRVYKCHYIGAHGLDSLIEADIYLNESTCYYKCHMIQFVEKLYNVKCLTLSTPRLEVLDSSFSLFVNKFHNLTELNLRADWRFITSFLENANNLRVLTISPMVDHNAKYWNEPKEVPSCLISHLETMNILDFGWSNELEFDLVRYILKNAKILKLVKILNTQLDSNKKLEALGRLSLFERGSETCQLTFF